MRSGKVKRVIGRVFGRKETEGESYRNRVLGSNSPGQFVRGTADDRTFGLDAAFARADGASVLDIGCNDGLVSSAFAERGASFIDGIDFSPVAVETARNGFLDKKVDAQFQVLDLMKGFEAVSPHLRRKQYDIVCYLGVHQHLHKQMTPTDLVSLEGELFNLAGNLLIVRTGTKFIDALNDRILQSGFAPITEKLKGNISPIRSYVRAGKQ
jgi:SAM-dependent methyltransferase